MFIKKNLIKNLFLCLVFILPTQSFSQDNSLHLKRGRLFTSEGFEIKFKRLNQQRQTFTIETVQGKFESYDQNEILRIEKRSGSEALIWGGYFGALTLVESFIYLKLTEDTFPRTDRKQFNKKIMIGATALGTIVGMLVGSYKGKYKNVYDDPAFSLNAPKLDLNFSSPNNISSLTLSYQF